MICDMSAEAQGATRKGEPLDLRTVIDTIPALVVSALPDGSVEFVNHAWREYTGSALEELTGWGWQSVIHPDDVSKFTDEWNAARAAGKPFENEARVRRSDGQYRWFLIRKVPLRDQANQIVRWYGNGYDIEERKRTEDHIRLVVDTTPALLHSARPDGYVDFLNQGWLDYLGLPLEDACGWNWTNAFHPDDVGVCVGKWLAALASGESFEAEGRVRRADGEYRMLLHSKVPLRDDQGNVVKWYGSSIDIEYRKRAEYDLRRSEAQFQMAIDTIPGLVWSALPDGYIDFLNQRWREYTGLTLSEAGGWGWQAAIHPDDVGGLVDYWRSVLTSGKPGETEARLRRFDGVYRWFLFRGVPLYDGMGKLIKWYRQTTDINERKCAEEKIRRTERELRQVLDLSPQHIAEFGPDGSRLYVNRVALDYRGITLEQWKSADLHTLFHPQDAERLTREIPRKFLRGTPFETEGRFLRKDGQYRWFLLRYNPLRDEQGSLTRWYAAGTDIEDRKQAEQRLQNENIALREEIDRSSMFEEIVGVSSALHAVLSRVSKVAPTDSTVLITGETGTGKELIARAVHKRSQRSSRAFVSVNCAAVPRDLIASELFGHEKGAFTGATQRRVGRFELAEGGTIFLDEIGELPAETQIALLRVLQEHEFERVGGAGSIRTNVRVIAATNRDLEAAIAAGTFRSDLFYRLNVFPIEAPPLRERREDISVLVEYFIDRYARKAGKSIRGVSKKSLELLQSYSWPGNIRESQNVIERSVIVCDTENFSVDESWLSRQPRATGPQNHLELSQKLASREKEMIEAVLNESGGRVFGPSGAAAKLGMPRSTLESKIRSLKIDKKRFKTLDPSKNI
jgi:formate hydrogenlyase transcriptional activator